jgi:hypothetical protein
VIATTSLTNSVELARATYLNFELLNGAYEERYTLEDIVEEFKKNHFPNTKLFLIPKFVVFTIAKMLQTFNFLNIGIHPERVLKLIKSTNIYPTWLHNSENKLNGNLASALQRWSDSTDGKFN